MDIRNAVVNIGSGRIQHAPQNTEIPRSAKVNPNKTSPELVINVLDGLYTTGDVYPRPQSPINIYYAAMVIDKLIGELFILTYVCAEVSLRTLHRLTFVDANVNSCLVRSCMK